MKFLPINTSKRVNTGDSLGHGMDAVIMLAIFLLGGYGLDRLFGTIETLCVFVFKPSEMAKAQIFQYLIEPRKKFVIRMKGVEFLIGLEKSLL